MCATSGSNCTSPTIFLLHPEMDRDDQGNQSISLDTLNVDSSNVSPRISSKSTTPSVTRPLVKQNRARIVPSTANYYYSAHTLASSSVTVQASSTGNNPLVVAMEGGGGGSADNTISANPPQVSAGTLGAPGTADTGMSRFQEDFDDYRLSSHGGSLGTVGSRTSGTGVSEMAGDELHKFPSFWRAFCRLLTFLAVPKFLASIGIKNKHQQQAWREKMGLIFCIMLVSAIAGVFTFGLGSTTCMNGKLRIRYNQIPPQSVVIHGKVFNTTKLHGIHNAPELHRVLPGNDASLLFQNVNHLCNEFITRSPSTNVPVDDDYNYPWYFPCKVLTPSGHYVRQPNIYSYQSLQQPQQPLQMTMVDNYTVPIDDPAYGCHVSAKSREMFYGMPYEAEVYYTWEDIHYSMRRLVVYLGEVIDLDRLWLLESQHWVLQPPLSNLSDSYYYPKDVTKLYGMGMGNSRDTRAMRCLTEIAKVGVIDTESLGCLTSMVLLILSLVFIFSLIGLKFVFAVYYQWIVAWRMGGPTVDEFPQQIYTLDSERSAWQLNLSALETGNAIGLSTADDTPAPSHNSDRGDANMDELIDAIWPIRPKPVIFLITVYSEEEAELRCSLDALANSQYPDQHKLILAICDGVIKREDGEMATHDVILSMMRVVSVNHGNDEPYSYVASASKGYRRHNRAKIYCGYYSASNKQNYAPMILIVKTGMPLEQTSKKPGNRGKRDSQLILMCFLQKVIFDERMTDLENEMYRSIYEVTKRLPAEFDLVLMVDADTQIYPDSVYHMVEVFNKDDSIVGLCGETRLANKNETWVTRIQVFEYFISHHLTKAFESIFGGVTCLPGCFCMYLVKIQKGSEGYYLPILANPDIVERYSDNQVDTLHKKNLLLLGEDRYLSTLMLKTFPQRKQVFAAKAKCNTQVPSTFRALLHQRRRWINSTIHNLMELILVKDLCGVFCFSMQFVVFIELVGTVTLPACLVFTVYLIVVAGYEKIVPVLPLALLVAIIGIPAVLIIVTGHKWSYLLWMVIYLCSLPVWNFVLPLNAFWKFDEFSWGVSEDHEPSEKVGRFDSSHIRMTTARQYLAMKYPHLTLKYSCPSVSFSEDYDEPPHVA